MFRTLNVNAPLELRWPGSLMNEMNEGGAFSLVISLPWLLVRAGIKLQLVCIEASFPTNWTYQSVFGTSSLILYIRSLQTRPCCSPMNQLPVLIRSWRRIWLRQCNSLLIKEEQSSAPFISLPLKCTPCFTGTIRGNVKKGQDAITYIKLSSYNN